MRIAGADEVMRMLRDGQVVRDVRVEERISFVGAGIEGFKRPVHFVDCVLGDVDISSCGFSEPISFTRCSLRSLFGMSTFFFGGLVIDNCAVAGNTELSCGGHNRDGEVRIVDTYFVSFVDFSDECFLSSVRISGCDFAAGTNLLHPSGPLRVHFEVPPVIVDNRGELALSTNMP